SERIADALRNLTPDVEPYADDAASFFLSGAGLAGLFRSASAWGSAIRAALRTEGFSSAVAVGFTRFGAYAIAKRGEPLVTFRSLEAERQASREVPLDRLGLEPALRDFLAKLGIFTVGEYLALPLGGLFLRFGAEAARLHEVASGTLWDPLRPETPVKPVEARVSLEEHPEGDKARLLFVIKGALVPMLAELAVRGEALSALYLGLRLERIDAPQEELIKPAEPTLDEGMLVRLLHLRLESSPPRAGVLEVHLRAASISARAEQLELFHRMQRRDLRAGAEALAQLRADLGNDAVRKAVLREGHLPEAQFTWEPLDTLRAPRPRLDRDRALVRRLRARPEPLSALPAAGRAHGPFVVSGGWWRGEIAREYAFVETERGACLWLYYDRRRGRWFLHGAVE
ncbi:MAG: DNA polymerase Y family protein, partial [Polyangiaceae bacterium]|nr:DNA polymerase Y family protein [Polyangiaceae bacterium]